MLALHWHVDSAPLDHQGNPQQLFKWHEHVIETQFKKSLCFYFSAMKLISSDQNQFTIHNLVFLHAYTGPGNLLNTLIAVFPLPLILGHGRTHGLVCWCEDILPAGKCRQWPPRGELRPHLKGCPSSLPCLLSTLCLDKKQLWPTACHLYTLYIHSLSWPPAHLLTITQHDGRKNCSAVFPEHGNIILSVQAHSLVYFRKRKLVAEATL